MLQVLKDLLPNDLHIKSVKELSNRYKIVFEFENDTATAELYKMCKPGAEHTIAFDTIKTAMSTIYFDRQDYVKCKEWLDKRLKW